MKVDISGPYHDPEDGPLIVELDEILAHRVEVKVDGKILLSADVRTLFLRGIIENKNSTVLELERLREIT